MNRPLTIGEYSIQTIVEQDVPLLEPERFFPDLTAAQFSENLDWLRPVYLDPATGKLMFRIQSYLVRGPHHCILVDTCVGNHKPRPGRPVWDMMNTDRYERNLAASGVGVGDIDFVMCTHLHVDHVGWNTRLDNGRWVPTFPNARYLFSDRELAFWTERQRNDPAAAPWIADSVLPVVEANRVDMVRSDHALNDRIRLVPTPGHTIDHYAVRIDSGGGTALLTGDMIHSPLQARYPELGMFVDYDRKQGGETRRRILGELCDTPAILCTGHFPEQSAGYVTRWGDGFRFNPLDG